MCYAVAIATLLLLAGGCAKPSPSPPGGGREAPSGTIDTAVPVATEGSEAALKPAPDFSFTAFDGTNYSLAELKGRPLILFFWSSHCPACTRAAPHVEALHQQHASEDLLVLGVAGFDSKDALKAKAKSLGVTFPIAISAETSRSYGVRAIPMAFFINREGAVAASILGAKPMTEFEAALQRIL
jgi:peroxiredoxin